MKLFLEIIAGSNVGKTLSVLDGQRMEVGRAVTMPIRFLNDRRMSRRHFLLELRGETCTLEDLQSSNGTFVNGNRVLKTVIRAGDHIMAGDTVFLVRADDAGTVNVPEATAPVPVTRLPEKSGDDAFAQEEDFLAEAIPSQDDAIAGPEIKLVNTTLFPCSTLLWRDAEGELKLTVVVKASFYLDEDLQPKIASSQQPVFEADQHYDNDIQRPVRLESDMVPFKRRVDVVLIGKAHAPQGKPVRSLDIGLRVGKLDKIIRVFGDRYWVASPGGSSVTATEPRPFTCMELTYERAYGGYDESTGAVYDCNPIGTGYVEQFSGASLDGVRLPNFEDPDNLIRSWQSRPKPAGFGFYGRGWSPRSNHLGEEDSVTRQSPEFFNGAHPDLQLENYLTGNEVIELVHLSDVAQLKFHLPRLSLRVQLNHRPKPGAVNGGALSARKEEDAATLAGGNIFGTDGEVVLDTLVLLPEEHSFYEVFRTVFSLSRFTTDDSVEVIISA